jgi:hypothetical protein
MYHLEFTPETYGIGKMITSRLVAVIENLGLFSDRFLFP